MNIEIRAPKDFWMGVVYAGLGAAGFVISRDYAFGSSARMGPGYFPSVVSGLLVVFGFVSFARSFVLSGPAIGGVAWKPLALVVGSQFVFAALVERAGFVVAGTAMLFVCAAASRQFRFDAWATAGALALVAACAVVFVQWLSIPMPLFAPALTSFFRFGSGS